MAGGGPSVAALMGRALTAAAPLKAPCLGGHQGALGDKRLISRNHLHHDERDGTPAAGPAAMRPRPRAATAARHSPHLQPAADGPKRCSIELLF